MKSCILIADTDASLAQQLGPFFRDHGYHAVTMCDGLDCVAKLRELCPDILILDLAPPWGGGDGVVASMCDDPAIARVPVILTDRSANYDVSQLPIAPIACLAKPFPMQELLNVVRQTTFESCDATSAFLHQADRILLHYRQSESPSLN